MDWFIDLIMGNKYVTAVAIFIAFYALSEIAVYLFEKVFLTLTKKTETEIDDIIVRKLQRPLSLLLLFVGIKMSMLFLAFEGKTGWVITKMNNSLIAIIVIYVIVSLIKGLLDFWGESFAKKTASSIDDHLIDLLKKAITVAFFIAIVLVVLKIWGVEIGPLLAGLGIGGIAIAFALQSSLSNIFGGISLILDKNIKVGEIITLDSNTKGTVMDIGLRSTKIKTFDNEIIIIPNGDLSNQRIHNNTQPTPSARIAIEFGVAYGSDIAKVKKIVLKEVAKIEGQEKGKEPMCRFTAMADSALIFKVYFWMKEQKERFRAKDEANTLIYNALNKNKISIPFPQMDVYLRKMK